MFRLASIALVVCAVSIVGTARLGVAAGAMALPDCQFAPEVRPSSVMFACGDGGVYATGVRWNNWGAPFATATATMHANDCEPNCAQGHFHVYAAYLAVTGHQRCSNGESAYTKVAYVPRTQGMPSPHSHLNWLDMQCH